MKIGFKVNDHTQSNLNLCEPDKGNPGMGGSEYSMVILSYIYAKSHPEDEIFVLHKNPTNKYAPEIREILVDDPNIPKVLASNKIEVLVLINATYEKEWYDAIKRANSKIIYVMANFMQLHHLAQYRNNDVIDRIVFVGKEQYSWCMDDEIIKKSCVIGNMIPKNPDAKRALNRSVPIVTYMGAILPQKGFHLLAFQWKKILKKVPNAQLYVIGSGNLYSSNMKMGKYGIAPQEYEQVFMPYLLDDDGRILPSVHFMGKMGVEKEDILKKTWVGVPNPSADTETFCNCAVEMEGYGIPIVTIAKNSFFDVTKNHYSSLLYYSSQGFRRNLIRLLSDEQLNIKMGKQAAEFAEQFTPEFLVKKWETIFNGVGKNEEMPYLGANAHMFYNAKILRVLNRFLRIHLHLVWLPTAIEGFRSGLKRR